MADATAGEPQVHLTTQATAIPRVPHSAASAEAFMRMASRFISITGYSMISAFILCLQLLLKPFYPRMALISTKEP
jgi:hypothetical protein